MHGNAGSEPDGFGCTSASETVRAETVEWNKTSSLALRSGWILVLMVTVTGGLKREHYSSKYMSATASRRVRSDGPARCEVLVIDLLRGTGAASIRNRR